MFIYAIYRFIYSKIKKPNKTLLDDQCEAANTPINALRLMRASGL